MTADRYRLKRRIDGLRRREKNGKPIDRAMHEISETIEASRVRLQSRREGRPLPEYPEALPVSARRVEIAAAIEEHQVIVLAGETGSGKTTQLPKICLELGRGVAGLIGHTQPRRIAARSVATRIAEELKTEPGKTVGYKVRFTDHVSPSSCIKLMTDGILLAEIQHDRLLTQYDTIIIDEAHERSLNIDFLLGYLKRLLPRRPDLKIIITSATINTEQFSHFFDAAPIIEVSGRTYPVELRYRPLLGEDEESRDRDMSEAILDGVDELSRESPLGDILIFLPGERQIRETAEALRKHRLRDTEVLPLYARLSAAEQDRVFRSHRGRRIVLATNVAETSLTVPGIQFVIDTGMARISRYSHRTKVQRLPIEPVSQASANQRAGRCGRVSAGICIRLYSEQDYLSRSQFTDPELLRTNLASVILQMAALDLGEVNAFPFLDAPDQRYINDGYRILHELGAVDERYHLTAIGRKLARLPVDPRIGRMLLAADREGCLDEVLTIASALSVQDPRERPLEAQQAADEAHARYHHEQSDFLALLKVWDYYHDRMRHLSHNKLRKLCRKEFLSYLRLREWHDIHGQLLSLVKDMGLCLNQQEADYRTIHCALLTGLLGNIAFKSDKHEYTGARNIKLAIFPGSGLFKKQPKWIMAAELVETTRLYARSAARIEPEWIEPLAKHLVKRSYLEPHWAKRPAQVSAYERVTLYGLIIVPKRVINYGPIDPQLSRELFIRHALVEGDYRSGAPFFQHNRQLLEEVEQLEAKSRRRDIMVDEQVLFEFYDARIPEGIYSGKHFEKWRKQVERDDPKRLFLTKELLMLHEAGIVTENSFPDQLAIAGMQLGLDYRFEPGHPADGVTLVVPLAALPALEPAQFEWLVPGLLKEKIIAMIKSLPKSLRRNFVPAVNFAEAALDVIKPGGSLNDGLTRQLQRMTGIEVPRDAWQLSELPLHLMMNFRIVDERGRVIQEGRDLEELKSELLGKVRESLAQKPATGLERAGITRWDFGTLPEIVEVEQQGLLLRTYPALVDDRESVAIRLFESRAVADHQMRSGMVRLFMLQLADKLKYLYKSLPGLQQMCLYYAPVGHCEELRDSIIRASMEQVLLEGVATLPREQEEFERLTNKARPEIIASANELAKRIESILKSYHNLAKALKQPVPPDCLEAIADMRGQLGHLIYPGFVTETPPEWLYHIPRYLKAIERRLEKLKSSPQRDRQLMREVQGMEQRWIERFESRDPHQVVDPELLHYRWLLEELRVSLFAQELKTLIPVSSKRLEKKWQEITSN